MSDSENLEGKHHTTGDPGSLFVTNRSKNREHMRQSLGLEICYKMEVKIDETYQSCGKNSLLHLSYHYTM